jgi:hypothetical protein
LQAVDRFAFIGLLAEYLTNNLAQAGWARGRMSKLISSSSWLAAKKFSY